MDVKQKYQQLEMELKPLLPMLGKAADAILDQEVSKYPIFIIAKNDVAIGLPLIERAPPHWSVNATTLEEFATKGLIEPEKVEDFREVYKDPQENLCLFVIDEEKATFIFLPRT